MASSKGKPTKKLRKAWRRQRQQSREDLQFEYTNHRSMPGTMMLSAFIADLPWPVGCVWYRTAGRGHNEVLHSYVIPWNRGNGVRTALHKEMRRGYPGASIFTSVANSKSRLWLKKMGFSKKRIGWWLE